MKLVITVTDESSSVATETEGGSAGALAGGAAGALSGGDGEMRDGGPMPDLLRAMAEEVEAGRIPPPGQAR